MRPIISFNYGARDYKRMKETIIITTKTIGAILLGGTLLFIVATKPILSLFSASQAMLVLGIPGLRVLALGFVISTFGTVMSGVFEAFRSYSSYYFMDSLQNYLSQSYLSIGHLLDVFFYILRNWFRHSKSYIPTTYEVNRYLT